MFKVNSATVNRPRQVQFLLPQLMTTEEKFTEIMMSLHGTEGCTNVFKMKGLIRNMEEQAFSSDENGLKAAQILEIIDKFHGLMKAVGKL